MWLAMPLKDKHAEFAVVDAVIVGIHSSKLQDSEAAPKFERGRALLAPSAMGSADSASLLIFSTHTPPYEDFSGRGSSPHASPGWLFLSAAAMAS
jgi:hypothetical protein